MIDAAIQKKQVLLVDDDNNVSQMLKLLLETRGYEVEIAHSGQDAFRKINSGVDIILLDLILPDLDGFEVCRRFKQNRESRHIPIIILSAKYLFEDKVEGLYLGADDYLTKPFEHEELVARMEAVMRRGGFPELDPQHVKEEDVVLELRKILDQELIIPFFQPIYFLRPLKLFGLEVLTRPVINSALSNPELLFRAALKYGVYNELEILCWRKAVKHVAQHITDRKLFLNCNPYLVEGPRFFMIKSIFEEHHVSPSNVVLEITERSRITNYKLFYEHLKKYRECGFRFAVDDVGGGFASLESIVETKPEVVKIDRHIVCDLDTDPFKRSIIKFIVSFCKENNIISIAEGIETRRELDILNELGVDAGQGYFLYRPTSELNMQAMSQIFLK
ncbi:MAG: hypothetical protein A2787_07020 [Omnitrophica WOR_2 bacterium RIFCSPHIGHO2_01_FULL_48_9]|nr:MAG: hypothetical protein A3D10_08300 [Omnitrophica WOR_2 bacterium RIFCSPHIGHO2_02_FULL_48_11]OGX31269.1 MAG: hypothetical protein A2787_07020 [Omnitrophica WOR_2 bacterium RIFCSPHIGHO2_01_FULL_48_9]